MLNTCLQEMARLTDQRKAHALCMLAEKERYRREATEAGTRQRADNRRRTHDEISRNEQLVKQNTIVDYLENVLSDCIGKMGEKSARDQIRDVVRKIDLEAEDPTPQRVVTGILDRFVMPDVFTHIARENHLADVHESLFGKAPDMISEHKRARINRFLATAVSPRDVDDDAKSGISSLDSFEDPAHHEALRCVELALSKALKRSEFDERAAYSLLDEIINSVIPDNDPPKGDQLTEIVSDINDQLWQAVDDAESVYVFRDRLQTDVQSLANSDSMISKLPALTTPPVRTSIWLLDDGVIVDMPNAAVENTEEGDDLSMVPI